jgi:hypothetical protein
VATSCRYCSAASLFGELDKPVQLSSPRVVESNGVTHLYYAVGGATTG